MTAARLRIWTPSPDRRPDISPAQRETVSQNPMAKTRHSEEVIPMFKLPEKAGRIAAGENRPFEIKISVDFASFGLAFSG